MQAYVFKSIKLIVILWPALFKFHLYAFGIDQLNRPL